MATLDSSVSTNPVKPDGYRTTGQGRQNGFTLIELMVVIGITVVLMTIVTGYSREGGRQLALVGTETKMLNLFSRAKFLSVETFFGGGRSGDQRICAYGVKVDASAEELFIFQDLSSDAKCPGTSNGAYNDGERLTGELNEVKLENTVVVFGESDLSEVIFIPPDPQTKVRKTDNSEVSSAKLTVKLKEGNGQFVIIVNNVGQIKTE